MANYSIALGVQPPQIDVGRQFQIAGQMRRDQIAEQAAALANKRAQIGFAKETGEQNALETYNKLAAEKDPNAINALAAYPEAQNQVMQFRQRLGEEQRKEFDQRLIRNARRAQRVGGLQGEERNAAWREELKAAYDAGDITPDVYERYSKTPPNDLVLHNVIQQALPIEKALESESGKDMHVGDRVVRIMPDGSVKEVYAPPVDPIDALVAKRLEGMNAPTAAPPAGVQPQSYQGGAARPGVQPVSNQETPTAEPAPGVVLAADETPTTEDGTPLPDVEGEGRGGYNPGDVYSKPANDLVDTPLGRMSRGEARTLAGGLSKRNPQLSKMMIEAAGVGSADLSKVARNEIDKKELNATEYLSRLGRIEEQFDPKFLTLEGKVKNYAVSWADSIDTLRKKVPPEDLAELSRFTTFKQTSLENINAYIKEITGAQMSEAEAGRLRKAAPDPENDSPTEFQTKMKNSVNATRLAVIRYRYLRKNGFNGQPWKGSAAEMEKAIPLGKMQGILDERAGTIFKDLKASNPKATDAELRSATKAALSADLGLDI